MTRGAVLAAALLTLVHTAARARLPAAFATNRIGAARKTIIRRELPDVRVR